MAYISGSAFSAADLITALTTFCTAHGWTLSSGVLSKGSVHIRPSTAGTTRDFIKLEIGDTAAFVTSADIGWGAGNDAFFPYVYLAQIWPVQYRIFDIDDGAGGFTVIMSILEANQVDYFYLAFGFLANKMGTWNGGEWMYATFGSRYNQLAEEYTATSSGPSVAGVSGTSGGDINESFMSHHGMMFTESSVTADAEVAAPPTYLRCDLDMAPSRNFVYPFSPNITSESIGMMRFARLPLMRGKTLWNGESCLVPMHIHRHRASGTFSRLGTVCGVRLVRLDNYENGDVITLGPDRWMVLPTIKRNVANPSGTANLYHGWGGDSGAIAYAIKYDGP